MFCAGKFLAPRCFHTPARNASQKKRHINRRRLLLSLFPRLRNYRARSWQSAHRHSYVIVPEFLFPLTASRPLRRRPQGVCRRSRTRHPPLLTDLLSVRPAVFRALRVVFIVAGGDGICTHSDHSYRRRHARTHVHTHLGRSYRRRHARTHKYTQVHTRARMRTCTRTCNAVSAGATHVHAHTRTYTRVHAHIHTPAPDTDHCHSAVRSGNGAVLSRSAAVANREHTETHARNVAFL